MAGFNVEEMDLLAEDEDLDQIFGNMADLGENTGNYGDFNVRQFKSVGAEDVDKFLEQNVNRNTRKKTESDLKIFIAYLATKGEQRHPQYIPPDQLNVYLCSFLLAVQKKDGKEYEPTTLRGIISSIDRYLRDNGSKVSIINDIEFAKARNVLKMKQKDLKRQGLGNKPKTAEVLSDGHLAKMYEAKTLGDDNPRALIHSMWLVCTTFFGMRTGQEVHSLRWGDVSLGVDDTCGTEYIVLDTERQTKTRTGLNPKDTRLVKPRAYANPDEPAKDPVHLYKAYLEKRPADTNTADSAFFLTPGSSGQISWFRKTPIGINKIYGIMQDMKDAAGIDAPRITPYSGRKRLVQKLNDDGVPPNQIIQISGHKTVNSLNNYSKLNNEQSKIISDILSNKKQHYEAPTPPTVAMSSTITSHSQIAAMQSYRPNVSNEPQIPPGFLVNPVFNGPVNFHFANTSSSLLTTKNTHAEVQMHKSPVFVCQNSNRSSIEPNICGSKRQRIVHYSDSE